MVGLGASFDLAAAAGEFEQVGLDVGDGVFQADQVDVVVQGLQAVPVVGVDHVREGPLESVQWRGGPVVALGHTGTLSGLGDQLLLGQEQVHLLGDQRPELVQQREFAGGVVAVVADAAAHDRPVLLLDMGLVVGMGRPAAGERDLARVAPSQQVVVDELRAVVGMDPGDVEREPETELVQSLGDDPLALGPDGDRFSPAGGDIGRVKAVVELAVVVPALVADQVDLQEAGDRVVPLLPGLERDRGLQ